MPQAGNRVVMCFARLLLVVTTIEKDRQTVSSHRKSILQNGDTHCITSITGDDVSSLSAKCGSFPVLHPISAERDREGVLSQSRTSSSRLDLNSFMYEGKEKERFYNCGDDISGRLRRLTICVCCDRSVVLNVAVFAIFEAQQASRGK